MSGRLLQRSGPGSAAYALLLLLSSAGHAAWGVPTDTVVHQTPSIYETHSGPARMIEHLSFFVLEITAAIFIVVASLLVYVIVRYRQRDPNDDSEPPQIYGSTQIEFAWTVIPILIVVVLFLTTARILFAIQDQKMPPTALDVDVVGHQFWWEFDYKKFRLHERQRAARTPKHRAGPHDHIAQLALGRCGSQLLGPCDVRQDRLDSEQGEPHLVQSR